MAKKKNRIEVLRYLLANNQFDSQDAIISELKKQGFKVAQPTLSRDLHILKVSKIFDGEGNSVYALPKEQLSADAAFRKVKVRLVQNFGFLKASKSGNLLVIKTLHGYASSLATEIDNFVITDILGTIAGDDTILVILAENCQLDNVTSLMEKIIPQFVIE